MSAPPPIQQGGGPPLSVRLNQHDRLQIEIKTELLSPGPTIEKAAWCMDVWFVLPQATGIGPGAYSSEDFYEDLRAYVRLKTPEVPLDALCTPAGEGSPLSVLHLLRDRARGGLLTGNERTLLRQESKLLCGMVKSQLRHEQEVAAGQPPEQLLETAARLAGLLQALMTTWRQLHQDLRPIVKEKSREVLDFCDESLSVQVEMSSLELLLPLTSKQRAEPGPQALIALARAESAYRAGHGWRTVVQASADGEFVDQARLLKKFVSSVLHLHLVPTRFDNFARQGALAVAAGLAMGWAVFAQLVMLFAWNLAPRQGVSLSFVTSFSVLAIAAYVLKDRIKASTGVALSKRLTAVLSDRRHDIHLADEQDASGRVSERMVFQRSSELPEEIQALRTASSRNLLLLRAEQDVLRYTRQIELRPRQAAARFPRLDGLSDILRLNVWRWIRTYSNARKEIPYVGPNGGLKVRKLDNLYFVDVFVRLRRLTPEPATVVQQLTLALNRRGIVSVEELDQAASAKSPQTEPDRVQSAPSVLP